MFQLDDFVSLEISLNNFNKKVVSHQVKIENMFLIDVVKTT
jgi:hypothetical protein